MPKIKMEKFNLTEKNILGEVEIAHLPRDDKVQYVSKRVSSNKSEEDYKSRSIKIVKVKGSYGTYLVKERKLFNNFKPNVLGDIFILISCLPFIKIMVNLIQK